MTPPIGGCIVWELADLQHRKQQANETKNVPAKQVPTQNPTQKSENDQQALGAAVVDEVVPEHWDCAKVRAAVSASGTFSRTKGSQTAHIQSGHLAELENPDRSHRCKDR